MTLPRFLCPPAPAETNDHPIIMDMLRCHGHATFTGLSSQDHSGARDYLDGFKGSHRHVPTPTGLPTPYPPLPQPLLKLHPLRPSLSPREVDARLWAAGGREEMTSFLLARRTLTATSYLNPSVPRTCWPAPSVCTCGDCCSSRNPD